MDEDTILGPLTTQKRLNEIEELVDITKKEGVKYYMVEKDPQVLIKAFFMNLQFLTILKIIIPLCIKNHLDH